MQQAIVDSNPPKDRYKLVYLILLLHGVGILMPWNMFITTRSYFVDYKMSKNYTGEDSNYATYFLAYVGFASQIPNIIFNWINVFINITGSITPRIVSSISIEILMFVVTIILAHTDSSKWHAEFFWTTMVVIVIMNITNGIYQNTIFGMAARLPFKYPGAVILGCNISGTLVSLIDLLIIVLSPSVRSAAVYSFIAAVFILLSCLATYFALPFMKFYRHYDLLKEKPKHQNENTNVNDENKIPYWRIFKKASSQLFNVFFVFFVTLSVFPAIQADIEKSDPYFIVPDKYYENILCFLTFNTSAMMGSLFSNWINWPSPKTLLVPILLRVLLIPFFFFCNYQPTNKVRKAPVLISSDWIYWAAGILTGLTSGYLSSKALIYTTKSVEEAYGDISGMFGAAVLVTGIFFGVMFSMIFPWLAEM